MLLSDGLFEIVKPKPDEPPKPPEPVLLLVEVLVFPNSELPPEPNKPPLLDWFAEV